MFKRYLDGYWRNRKLWEFPPGPPLDLSPPLPPTPPHSLFPDPSSDTSGNRIKAGYVFCKPALGAGRASIGDSRPVPGLDGRESWQEDGGEEGLGRRHMQSTCTCAVDSDSGCSNYTLGLSHGAAAQMPGPKCDTKQEAMSGLEGWRCRTHASPSGPARLTIAPGRVVSRECRRTGVRRHMDGYMGEKVRYHTLRDVD